MRILAIESSCDETAAAVVQDGRQTLSDIVYSQADMHVLYGGVVPEIASRKHAEKISLVARQALVSAGLRAAGLDAVAATCAPGLIGALLVGASFAKACAMSLGLPFIPVHHIRGHIAANYIAFPQLKPPFCALVASGGHTIIADVRSYTDIQLVGSTRDDAAGEAFDKIGRVLELGYPGGKALDNLSKRGKAGVYKLPVPVFKDAPFDFSFSGLKTAAVNLIHNAAQKGEQINKCDLAYAVSDAVAQSIVPRLIGAADRLGYKTIVAAGGVAANSLLRARLAEDCASRGFALYIPPANLCGDNAQMIGAQAYYEYLGGNVSDMAQNCFATMGVDEKVCKK